MEYTGGPIRPVTIICTPVNCSVTQYKHKHTHKPVYYSAQTHMRTNTHTQHKRKDTHTAASISTVQLLSFPMLCQFMAVLYAHKAHTFQKASIPQNKR